MNPPMSDPKTALTEEQLLDEIRHLRGMESYWRAEAQDALQRLHQMEQKWEAAFPQRVKAPTTALSESPNQCDGCRAGIPITWSRWFSHDQSRLAMHRMGTDAYPDYMVCEAEKYSNKAGSGDPRQEVKE